MPFKRSSPGKSTPKDSFTPAGGHATSADSSILVGAATVAMSVTNSVMELDAGIGSLTPVVTILDGDSENKTEKEKEKADADEAEDEAEGENERLIAEIMSKRPRIRRSQRIPARERLPGQHSLAHIQHQDQRRSQIQGPDPSQPAVDGMHDSGIVVYDAVTSAPPAVETADAAIPNTHKGAEDDKRKMKIFTKRVSLTRHCNTANGATHLPSSKAASANPYQRPPYVASKNENANDHLHLALSSEPGSALIPASRLASSTANITGVLRPRHHIVAWDPHVRSSSTSTSTAAVPYAHPSTSPYVSTQYTSFLFWFEFRFDTRPHESPNPPVAHNRRRTNVQNEHDLANWTAAEIGYLSKLVGQYGEQGQWKLIAEHLPGRSVSSCELRWLRYKTKKNKLQAAVRMTATTAADSNANEPLKPSLSTPGQSQSALQSSALSPDISFSSILTDVQGSSMSSPSHGARPDVYNASLSSYSGLATPVVQGPRLWMPAARSIATTAAASTPTNITSANAVRRSTAILDITTSVTAHRRRTAGSKTGRWSAEEDRALSAGVNAYLSSHGLEVVPPTHLPTEAEFQRQQDQAEDLEQEAVAILRSIESQGEASFPLKQAVLRQQQHQGVYQTLEDWKNEDFIAEGKQEATDEVEWDRMLDLFSDISDGNDVTADNNDVELLDVLVSVPQYDSGDNKGDNSKAGSNGDVAMSEDDKTVVGSLSPAPAAMMSTTSSRDATVDSMSTSPFSDLFPPSSESSRPGNVTKGSCVFRTVRPSIYAVNNDEDYSTASSGANNSPIVTSRPASVSPGGTMRPCSQQWTHLSDTTDDSNSSNMSLELLQALSIASRQAPRRYSAQSQSNDEDHGQHGDWQSGISDTHHLQRSITQSQSQQRRKYHSTVNDDFMVVSASPIEASTDLTPQVQGPTASSKICLSDGPSQPSTSKRNCTHIDRLHGWGQTMQHQLSQQAPPRPTQSQQQRSSTRPTGFENGQGQRHEYGNRSYMSAPVSNTSYVHGHQRAVSSVTSISRQVPAPIPPSLHVQQLQYQYAEHLMPVWPIGYKVPAGCKLPAGYEVIDGVLMKNTSIPFTSNHDNKCASSVAASSRNSNDLILACQYPSELDCADGDDSLDSNSNSNEVMPNFIPDNSDNTTPNLEERCCQLTRLLGVLEVKTRAWIQNEESQQSMKKNNQNIISTLEKFQEQQQQQQQQEQTSYRQCIRADRTEDQLPMLSSTTLPLSITPSTTSPTLPPVDLSSSCPNFSSCFFVSPLCPATPSSLQDPYLAFDFNLHNSFWSTDNSLTNGLMMTLSLKGEEQPGSEVSKDVGTVGNKKQGKHAEEALAVSLGSKDHLADTAGEGDVAMAAMKEGRKRKEKKVGCANQGRGQEGNVDLNTNITASMDTNINIKVNTDFSTDININNNSMNSNSDKNGDICITMGAAPSCPTTSLTFPATLQPHQQQQQPPPRFLQTREDYSLAISRTMAVCPWAKICAASIPGRSGVQAQARWSEALNPQVKKGPWTQEEDAKLLEGVRLNEKCWIWIADRIEGRTQRQCRTRWVQITTKKERAAAAVVCKKMKRTHLSVELEKRSREKGKEKEAENKDQKDKFGFEVELMMPEPEPQATSESGSATGSNGCGSGIEVFLGSTTKASQDENELWDLDANPKGWSF
ncbi:hypothetical protein EDD11_004428 [Mortierella claussenii]|nr:hypothetical protein EDD11_004428 [Mortierella claussenii]